jgi:hypothetical protein
MKDPLIAVMQNDHKHWADGCTTWLEDVKQWQEDHQNALEELERIGRAIEDRGKTLKEYVATIKSHEKAIDGHELAIAAHDPRYALEHEGELVSVHDKEATDHIDHKDTHEQMKKNHCAVLAQLALVLRVLYKSSSERVLE